MKHENHTETSRPALAVKTALSSVAAIALLGFSFNAQAQDCTVDNWTTQTNLADANTGTQGSNNRRYGGPCGLRVAIDGEERYLTDESPLSESTYIARFYVFLNAANASPTDEILIFAADDGTDDVIEVWYDGSDLTLQVYDDAASSVALSAEGIGSGWHSVEIVWESGESAEIRFAVNSFDEADDLVTTWDTSGVAIINAHLGNVNGASTGGTIDLDDFDSRRISRPGRLCRGLTDPDRTPAGDGWQRLTAADRQAVFAEIATGGAVPAGGQPDINEDGVVNSSDRLAIFAAIATGQNSCEVLR